MEVRFVESWRCQETDYAIRHYPEGWVGALEGSILKQAKEAGVLDGFAPEGQSVDQGSVAASPVQRKPRKAATRKPRKKAAQAKVQDDAAAIKAQAEDASSDDDQSGDSN